MKYQDAYNRLKREDSNRFTHFIDGKTIRLPDYFNPRTPEERFIQTFEALEELSEFHKNENYFKQEMAIYKAIKSDSKKVKKWLTKNESLGAEKYFMFSMDYFGDEDEIENEIHLRVTLFERKEIFVNRKDFKYTILFTHTFNNLYWKLLEHLGVEKLN
ncbi:MAG: hypothetical protein R2797_01905 [Gelidibacter sp.]